MSIILTAIAPVGLIIFIGFLAGKTIALEAQTLAQLAIYILSPALIGGSLYRSTLSSQSTIGLMLGFLLTSLSLYGLVWGIAKIAQLSPQTHKSLMVSTLFPNAGNVGLPLVTFALGTAGLQRAVIYVIISSLLIYSLAPALLQENGFVSGMRLTLRLPLLWAIFAGILLRLLAIKLPFNFDKSIEMLGNAAIPLALILLGIQLSSIKISLGHYEIFAAAMRLIGAPLIAYLVGTSLQLRGLDLQVLVLQSATPTAVNTVVLATRFGGDVPSLTKTVVVSTVLSFITLPFALLITTHLG